MEPRKQQVIHDPAIVQAIDVYFANGGTVHRIPFGVSGIHDFRFECNARHFGFLGWAHRYGRGGLPAEAIEFLEAGRLTTVQVRAPIVWETMRAAGPYGLPAREISECMQVAETSVRRSLSLLEVFKYAASHRRQRFVFYRALGERAPDWRMFMATPRLAA
jgi:hypothetical protein